MTSGRDAPPPLPPAMPSGPRTTGYWVALVLAIAAAGTTVYGVTRFGGSFGGLATLIGREVPVPGTRRIHLDLAGEYMVFRRTGPGAIHVVGSPSPVRVRITSLDTGQTIPLETTALHETREIEKREYIAERSFTIPRPGDYEFVAEPPASGEAAEIRIAPSLFGDAASSLGEMVMYIMGGVILGILAIILTVATYVHRGRARRANLYFES